MNKITAIICAFTVIFAVNVGDKDIFASSIDSTAVSIKYGVVTETSSHTNDLERFVSTSLKKYTVCVKRTRILNNPGKICYIPENTRWLYKNDIVYVLKITKGWAKIKVNNGWGFVDARHLTKLEDTNEEGTSIITKKYIVKVKKTVIRKGAGSSYKSAGYLYKGDNVNVKKTKNGWAMFKVRGYCRYVKLSHLAKIK